MGQIHTMSAALADRIAAGEVVERPASVVKELVENGLDAGALSIRVSLRGGGLTELVVEDDGAGMDADDAQLCLQRHATSKLHDDADLFAITTMGFRGEALASIAAVARLTLQTATVDEDGTEVRSEPGKPISCRPLSRRRGTRIVVSDLFYNTPARRQFLKTERSEAGAIQTWMSRLALANPKVAFSLRDERRERLQVGAADDASGELQRCEQLLGERLREGLHPLGAEREGYGLRAFVARPDLSRRDRRSLMIFVNGRFIIDRHLQQAVVEGFRSVLEVGRHPVAVVFLTIPPGMVDVNVHPQKTEVRLAQPRLVFSLIRNAVVEGLAAAPWLAASAQLSVAEPFAEPRFPSAQRTPSTSVFSGGGGRLALQSLSSALGSAAAPAESRQSELAGEPRHDPGPQTSLLAGSRYQDLRPIGQVATTYLLLEGASGLVLIDQHAAHERIVFGHLQCALAGERLPQQGLLLPVTLSLDAEEEAELSSHRDLVERFGFALSFEAGAVQVRAIPALLAGSDPARLLADLAGALVAGDGEAELERAVDAVIARLACHGSIRAGQHLDTDDIRALMVALDEAEHRSHCPHGRPFVVQLTTGSLEQWFHRA